MNLKNCFSSFLFITMLLGMVSCLGNGPEFDDIVVTDAQLVSLKLSRASIPALATTKFTIDQERGTIYNHDSLPYLTNITDSLLKITYSAGSGSTQSLRIADSTKWTKSDEEIKLINGQLKFTVFAPSDTTIRKEYVLTVNIHQIDPDSVIYTKLNAGDWYPSNEKPWETALDYGLYDETVIPLGFLHPDATNLSEKGLALIVSDGATDRFALYQGPGSTAWTIGSKTPDDFPRSEFSVLNFPTIFADQLTIMKNLKSVWATEDGLYWAKLANTTEKLPDIEGGVAFYYNNEIWFTGGFITEGDKKTANHTIYYSQDGGVVWKAKASKTNTPIEIDINDSYIMVDEDGKYFYIVTPTEVWKANINSQLFEH